MLKFSKEEISKHHSADDCWVIVDDSVYDLTNWVKAHPGGTLLTTLAGEDASALVYASHFENVMPKILRLKIGTLDNYQPQFSQYNDEFLATLKSRIQSYFADQKIDVNSAKSNHIRLFTMAVAFFILWLGMYLIRPWGVIAAVPLGLLTCAFVGAFGHEHIHNNLIRRVKKRGWFYQLLNSLAWGIFIPAMPESYFQYEHLKHHSYPMSSEEDYDIYALKDFVRLSPKFKKISYQKYQHIYAPLVYAFYVLLQIRGGYTTAFFKKRKLLFDRGILLNLIATTLVTLVFHVIIPISIAGFSWFVLCGLIYMITWQAAIYISSGVPHMTDIHPLLTNAIQSESANHLVSHMDPRTWPMYVCQTTKNLKCQNWFFDWLTGGLNYHIEHHLLPFIPREHLPKIQPIVEQTCKEFGYPYKVYPRFREFYLDHYRFLFELGRSIH